MLCYGASKSGKTHTLANLHIGEWGVLPQALSDVYVAALEKGGTVDVALYPVLFCTTAQQLFRKVRHSEVDTLDLDSY